MTRPPAIIAGTDVRAARRRRRHRRGRRGVRAPTAPPPPEQRGRLPGGDRRRDRGRPATRSSPAAVRRERPARGADHRRGRPHHRPAAAVRRRRAARATTSASASTRRCPTARPLPRADLRQRMVPLGPVAVFGGQQLPARLLRRRRRHRLRAGRRLPGGRQGPPRPPAAPASWSPAPSPARSRARPAGRHVLLRCSARHRDSARRWSRDPRIAAVGFTGSRGGGLALVAAAAARPVPIPVYAEMSSINPVVVLPGALAGRRRRARRRRTSAPDARRPASSAPTPACCSCPAGDGRRRVPRAPPARRSAARPVQPMLTPGIADGLRQRHRRACAAPTASRVVGEGTAAGEHAPAPAGRRGTAELLARRQHRDRRGVRRRPASSCGTTTSRSCCRASRPSRAS